MDDRIVFDIVAPFAIVRMEAYFENVESAGREDYPSAQRGNVGKGTNEATYGG
jgi:hypothetical protein